VATLAAYIDGFNLYYGMKSKYRRRYMWLDPVDLIRRLRPKDDIVVVPYFTAIVRGEAAAAQRQVEIFGCDEGKQPKYRSHEEKETDVALGAMMVADAATRIADTSLLVSADTDLRPALQAVRMVVPEQRIYLGMPPGNTMPSPPLLSVGDLGHFFIRESILRNAQLPEVVHEAATGRIIHRPAKWR
jgi:hypothetical protein